MNGFVCIERALEAHCHLRERSRQFDVVRPSERIAGAALHFWLNSIEYRTLSDALYHMHYLAQKAVYTFHHADHQSFRQITISDTLRALADDWPAGKGSALALMDHPEFPEVLEFYASSGCT